MANQPNDTTHADILKNFSIDEEDEVQLGDGDNEDKIEFDDDVDDDQSHQAKDDQPDDDADDDQPQQRRPATEDVDDDPDEKRRQDRFAFKEDRQGNFIDKDGNIIVRRGKARDVFVKIKKAYQKEQNDRIALATDFNNVVASAKQLLTRYNDLKATKNHFESVGLSDAEAKQAAELGALMKLDPKAGVRKILTILHLNGTDLSDIGVTGPVDAKEVARHTLEMQEARKPKEKSEEDKAVEEVQGFLGRHPTARQHSGVLAEAKRRFPHMTYDELWFELRLQASKQEKRDDKPSQQQRPPQRTIPRNSRRDTGPVERTANGKLSLKAVDPSQSFSQIGRDLLRDLREIERGQ